MYVYIDRMKKPSLKKWGQIFNVRLHKLIATSVNLRYIGLKALNSFYIQIFEYRLYRIYYTRDALSYIDQVYFN